MRKFIWSNLLLIMFLVGAASGFFVSSIGWWSLVHHRKDLDQLHQHAVQRLAAHADLEGLAAVEADYAAALHTNDVARTTLLAMSLAATFSFCLIAVMTYRESMERRRAEKSMRLANKVFENSSEGMAITDATGNILGINRTFSSITGYHAHEVIGHNPKILSSGRQSPEFYAAMWQAIRSVGRWQGEIWNKRRDGSIYPQWLNVSQVTDDQGTVTNYVGVFSDISERKSAEEQILHQLYYDRLTSLPNRMLLNDRLRQVLAQTKRQPLKRFAVMHLDLDRFKIVNDSMGHDAGDQLLQQAAHRIRGCLRESDTVARVGGDEFTIVLSDIHGAQDARDTAQRILAAFKQPCSVGQLDVFVYLSIGISIYPEDGNTTDALLRHADMAMYRAKHIGGSWFELYHAGIGQQASERLTIETAMHKAIERGEFMLNYQPQVDMCSGRIASCEALIRWRHPELGLIPPGRFIPLAEETGLILTIGEWTLRTACQQAKAWENSGTPLRIAVNLSARQFHQSDLAQLLEQLLQEFDLSPALLELELTEGTIMEDTPRTLATMERLHAMGIPLSIDDFGTGYSSLSYLKRLPIQILKIDQSFVRDIGTDPDDRAIVTAVIALAHSMKLKVIAEGVEQPEQLTFLRAHGCDTAQGYFFGKPMEAEILSALLDAEQTWPASTESAAQAA
jgi:diguanylate cyclase (GGDEF)-like protein/PAS domain S-box-containing protein